MRRCTYIIGSWLVVALSAGSIALAGTERPVSIEQEFQQIRYSSLDAVKGYQSLAASSDDFGGAGKKAGRKSPGLAFLMSAAVPGLGQYYTGSLVKAVGFLGVDVAAWALHVTWHGDGDQLTEDFEAFNRAHWSRESYEQKYLPWVYGGATDDDDVHATEVSHHLPEEMTQQYYEMTGKYDQFSWGWDDATLNNQTIDDFSATTPMPAVVGGSTVPTSVRRQTYEDMRHDANIRYDRARSMLMVALANRVISGFEAFFSAKKHNRNLSSGDSFGRVDIDASLKSLSAKRDTPWLTVAYKF